MSLLCQRTNSYLTLTVTLCNFSPKYDREAYNNFPVPITEEEFLLFYRNVLSNRLDKKTDTDYYSAKTRMLKERVVGELRDKGYVC